MAYTCISSLPVCPSLLQKLVPITDLPEFARAAFDGYQSLNRIQSRLSKTALQSDENLLLCAPTVRTPPHTGLQPVCVCVCVCVSTS